MKYLGFAISFIMACVFLYFIKQEAGLVTAIWAGNVYVILWILIFTTNKLAEAIKLVSGIN